MPFSSCTIFIVGILFIQKIHTVILTTANSFVLRSIINRGRRGRDRMIVGFTITYTISAYHH
jgi:hypothetical protein